jgi:hypothetical protein
MVYFENAFRWSFFHRMLQTVRNELDYRVDVCRITNGAHIEQL